MKRRKRKLLVIKMGAALLTVLVCIHLTPMNLGSHKAVAKRLVDQVVASGLVNSESDFSYDEFGNLKKMTNYLIKNGKKAINFEQTYSYSKGLIVSCKGITYIDGKKGSNYETRYLYNKNNQLIAEKYNTTNVDGEDADGEQYISEDGKFVKGTRPKNQPQIDRYTRYTYHGHQIVKEVLDASDFSTLKVTYTTNAKNQVTTIKSNDDTRTFTLDQKGNMDKQVYTILKHGNFTKKTDTYLYSNHYDHERELISYTLDDLGQTYTLHYKYVVVRKMHENTIDRVQKFFSNRYHVYAYGLED